MKKIAVPLLVITLLLCACTANPAPGDADVKEPEGTISHELPVTTPPSEETPAAENSTRPQGYPFNAYGQEIYISMEAQPVLAELPEPLDIFEAPSCAFDGVDITYFYPGFELTTYPENGKEHILSIVLTDDSVTTPEGIYIGGMTDEIYAAYGTGHTEIGGQITYTKETASLVFNTGDGVITGISYLLIIG